LPVSLHLLIITECAITPIYYFLIPKYSSTDKKGTRTWILESILPFSSAVFAEKYFVFNFWSFCLRFLLFCIWNLRLLGDNFMPVKCKSSGFNYQENKKDDTR